MPKISKSSDVVTKAFLKKELSVLGKKINNVERRFEQVEKKIDVTEKSLISDMRISLLMLEDRVEQRMEQKLTKFSDSIITTIDPLLAELEQRKQDRELASDQTSELRSQIDDHEKRIQTLEQIQPA